MPLHAVARGRSGGVAVDALFEIASIAPKYFILTKENADERERETV